MNRRDFLKRLAVIPGLAFLKPEAFDETILEEELLLLEEELLLDSDATISQDDVIYVSGAFVDGNYPGVAWNGMEWQQD